MIKVDLKIFIFDYQISTVEFEELIKIRNFRGVFQLKQNHFLGIKFILNKEDYRRKKKKLHFVVIVVIVVDTKIS